LFLSENTESVCGSSSVTLLCVFLLPFFLFLLSSYSPPSGSYPAILRPVFAHTIATLFVSSLKVKSSTRLSWYCIVW
jgi:hypothetical protein